MKSLISGIVACALMAAALGAKAEVTYTVDASASWAGYMNVFEIPANGGGYVFGSGWGTADLCATFSGGTLTLTPNTINDPNSFWYTPSGGPGATGNKTMEANMYVDLPPGTVLNGDVLTFSGTVTANTLAGSHTAIAFVKDFAADYSSYTTTTAPLTPGAFSISHATVNDPTRHVQYGFQMVGPCVWSTDVGAYGSIKVTASGSTPTPVPITPSYNAGTMGLSFPTQSGRSYHVELKTNLTDLNWGTLAVTNGTGSTVTVTTPTDSNRRFFRLSIQ